MNDDPMSLHQWNRAMNRRHMIVAGGVGLAASALLPRFAQARQGTPAATPEHDHGASDGPATMPDEITWTVTDETLTVPEQVSAGLNHLTVQNDSSGDFHSFSIRIPDDVSDEQLQREIESSTPDSPIPDWWTRAYFPGSPDWPAAGASISGHVRYEPGRYIVMDPFSESRFARFTVAGDAWGQIVPLPDVHLGMVEMSFTGLDAPVPAGKSLWSVTNHGATWHELLVIQVPEGSTGESILTAITETEGPEGYATMGGYGIASPGASGQVSLDLAAGSYAALCFTPDGFAGPPHAFMGMITPFSVE